MKIDVPKKYNDAHRHFGVLPAFGFYGGPPCNPDVNAVGTLKELMRDVDEAGIERTLIIPNYGVPDVAESFKLNEAVVEAAESDDRLRCAIWTSPRPQDDELLQKALALTESKAVRALKFSFLLGGDVNNEEDQAQIDKIMGVARDKNLVVHIHTSAGGRSDINEIGKIVDKYGDDVKIHLVHFGGGVSGHTKLINTKFFDWIEEGKQVYTDLTWGVGFAAFWLASEFEKRNGLGADRLLFASDEPWGDFAGEFYRLASALGGTELAEKVFYENFNTLYD